MKTSVLTVFLLLAQLVGFAQFFIAGKIVNKDNEEGIAFVTITINNNKNWGTYSDTKGNFKIETSYKIESIQLSCIGFQSKSIPVSENIISNITITLQPSLQKLQEIEILPGENPAHRIIKNTIAERHNNNPEKYQAYQCKIYTKQIIEDNSDYSISDSLNSHLFITESVSQRKFLFPNNKQETVLATKVSGFKNPQFAGLATDIQPFSFYKPFINLYGETYLNPISNNSTNEYLFQLKDTSYFQSDTTFIISFQPRNGKNFKGLQGVLHINTNAWAIENVYATPSDTGLLFVTVHQQYQWLNGKWFPKQLNYTAINKFDIDTLHFELKTIGYSEISEVDLSPGLSKKDFSFDNIKLATDAGSKSEAFWKENRSLTFEEKDSTTYVKVDSIFDGIPVEGITNAFLGVGYSGLMDLGYVSINAMQLYKYNQFEGSRWGLGLYTGEKISKRLILGGYFAHGYKDKLNKHGASIWLQLEKEHELNIGYQFTNDIFETGKAFPMAFYNYTLDQRGVIAGNMTSIKGHKWFVEMRPQKFTKLRFSLNHYQYGNLIPVENQREQYHLNKLTTIGSFKADLRFNYRELLTQVKHFRIATTSKYPVLHLSYTQNLNFLESDPVPFKRYEIRITDAMNVRKLGKLNFSIIAGKINGNLPNELLFGAFGSKIQDWRINTLNHFQTMAPYEFIANKYISLFFAQNLGTLLFKGNSFQPKIAWANNIGFSAIEANYYYLKTMNKGFYETGIIISDILRANLDFAYFGLGFGAYYRYGPYTLPKTIDNATFNIDFKVSFR